MKILVVGAGGVGASFAPIAARRDFYEHIVFADYDEGRAQSVVDRYDGGTGRFSAAQVDASDASAVAELCRQGGITHVLNAVDPRFVMPIFDGAHDAGVTYLDMAMSLSHAHPDKPYELPGEKLGDAQFAKAGDWEKKGQLALVGIGVEPGLSDVFARYAQDHLFSQIDEAGVRDGANLVVSGYDFAPGFSIWTTIEECLNPPVVWEKGREWFTLPPFSEPEVFTFPEGIGPVECVHVEHEEVLLIPRWVDCERATFKYGLGDEFIEVLKTLHKLGLDKTDPVTVRGQQVSPRDVGDGHRSRRQPTRGVPVSRRGQRGDVGPRRGTGRGVADGDQPGRRARAARERDVVGRRGARARSVPARSVPRSADRVRIPLGDGGAYPRLATAVRPLFPISLVEQDGVDIPYSTDLDLDRQPGLLLQHRA